ncbi:MAG: hypothetical protein PHE50_05845 [Dehalococcoidales bacterium]|nr:hypothetical protein [Dehalococcoidales bacterium]
MNKPRSHNPETQITSIDNEAIRYFRAAIKDGVHWYIALLEAIKMWQSPEETYEGRYYRYILDETALDWLLLAERLCDAVGDLAPEDEKQALLLENRPPLDITKDEFRQIIGEVRYNQYLNYFYGVNIERALILAVQEEVRKERRLAGLAKEEDTTGQAYIRVYGDTEENLLAKFRRQNHYRRLKSISLDELKEFTYWLFRFRVKHSEKPRVASDTKKALDWVQRNGLSQKLVFGQ